MDRQEIEPGTNARPAPARALGLRDKEGRASKERGTGEPGQVAATKGEDQLQGVGKPANDGGGKVDGARHGQRFVMWEKGT
jgi:hypothetical protein